MTDKLKLSWALRYNFLSLLLNWFELELSNYLHYPCCGLHYGRDCCVIVEDCRQRVRPMKTF